MLSAYVYCISSFEFGRFDKREADLLSTLNRIEVEREEETSTLFRGATLTTALMDLYMRSVCTEVGVFRRLSSNHATLTALRYVHNVFKYQVVFKFILLMKLDLIQ